MVGVQSGLDAATTPAGGRAAAIIIAVAIFTLVCLILRAKGTFVQASACVFIVSLVSTQLLMKELTSPPISFRFPAWVTVLHFSTVWLLCVLYWAAKGQLHMCLPRSAGSTKRYLAHILPIAASLPLSVVFNNQALLFVGAGLAAIVGTLTPVTTAVLSHIMGRKIARFAWVGVSIAVAGAVIITWGKLGRGKQSDSVISGLLLAIGAVLLRSIKVVLQDKLLAPRAYDGAACAEDAVIKADEPLAPMHVWVLQAPPCVLVSVIYAFIVESLPGAVRHLTPGAVTYIVLSCASASVLNILGMFTIKQLGGSSMQIIGKLNTIVLVTFSVAFFGEALQRKVIVGTCLVLCGVSLFEYAEQEARKKDARPNEELPIKDIKGLVPKFGATGA